MMKLTESKCTEYLGFAYKLSHDIQKIELNINVKPIMVHFF